MNTRILNRQGKLPDDGFYHIEALGEHVNHAHRVVQVIDEKAVTSIVNRFKAVAEKAGEGFAGQRIDKDHLSHDQANDTAAMGWTKEVTNRADGLYARINWTPLGRPLIKPENPADDPAYKFFSTEYDEDNWEKIGTRVINKKVYAVIRPLSLDGLALTNDPNNRGQRGISNRKGDVADADNQPDPTMKEVNKLLGLAEDASEASAVEALRKIQNRATQAEASVTSLTAERDTLRVAVVEADLEKYKNRYKPEQREAIKGQLITNRAGTILILEAMAEPAATTKGGTITNRSTATPPAGERVTTDEAAADQDRAKKIMNRANELRRLTPSRSFDSCWHEAQQEIYAATE